MKIFKGRVINKGHTEGVAAVSRQGLNPLAAWKNIATKKFGKIYCADQNNKDLYKKRIDDQIICMPQVIGSTTAGVVLQSAVDAGFGPRAMLFSKHIDSLAASAIILADIWQDKKIIAIDQLGDEFLEFVETGMIITINEDGTVEVEEDV